MTESDHDADGLSAPEEDMIRMLVARNQLEVLVSEQQSIEGLRSGQIVTVKWVYGRDEKTGD